MIVGKVTVSRKATGLQLQPGNLRFLEAGPVGRRQSHNCNLETRAFLGGKPSWSFFTH